MGDLIDDPALPTRFWDKVCLDLETGCWNWVGCRTRDGYGHLRSRGKDLLAHRVSYQALVGTVPVGLVLDHVKELCSSRACVNPAHLEPVSQRENVRRGRASESVAERQRSKTHCKHGHEFDSNSYVDSKGHRVCRPCRNTRRQQTRRRNRCPAI